MLVNVTITTADLQAALRIYVQDKFPDATIGTVTVQSYEKEILSVECDVRDGLILVPEISGGLRHRARP